ncbi:MAG: biopolymer transport ExbD protein [Candidatus Scalindua rubra]|uniref:Biopolymer transport ExbD protein n=1 Tax=Candidatus Scalindua rubra TaxID=1872076 RepID=A0A1E3XER6_9BACT|nr:MAG: biopolymer transport ExbD protein [Candidatus Scalindua rubra]
MKLSRKYTGVPEFNMLALLDIIFIIVIFCIIGMTKMVFLELVDVKNPELQITRRVEPKDFVTITITKNGKLFFNKDQVFSKTELSKKLVEKKRSGNDVTVIINGDTDALLGDALHILQLVREADLPKVYFKADSTGKG